MGSVDSVHVTGVNPFASIKYGIQVEKGRGAGPLSVNLELCGGSARGILVYKKIKLFDEL